VTFELVSSCNGADESTCLRDGPRLLGETQHAVQYVASEELVSSRGVTQQIRRWHKTYHNVTHTVQPPTPTSPRADGCTGDVCVLVILLEIL